MDYAEIVDTDVRELRATCDLADRPDARRGGLQPLVDLDVSPVGELNAGQFEAESFGVRIAAGGDQYMTTLQDFLNSILFDDDTHRVAGFARHLLDPRIQENVDAFICEQAAKSLAYVRVFFGHQPPVAIDHRHLAAEAAHRLGHLHSDVTPTDNQQVFGNFIEFKSLDMRERLRFRKARNCLQCGARARTNDHIRAPQSTCGPIGQGDFHCSRSQEPSRSQYELGSRVPVIFHIHVVQAPHHPALALAHARHVDREAVECDAEFLASAKVVHNFRTMDNVLARKARNIRARAANILAIDDCDALAFASKRPRSDGRARATTENHQIKFFRLRLLKYLSG